MKQETGKKPFFVRLLEQQGSESSEEVGPVTQKYPSDQDEQHTLKYPSDGDDWGA
ncbi:MAG: microviridin/marinostatin family tricyclic proteinase inhibitor [Cystobacter sp.]